MCIIPDEYLFLTYTEKQRARLEKTAGVWENIYFNYKTQEIISAIWCIEPNGYLRRKDNYSEKGKGHLLLTHEKKIFRIHLDLDERKKHQCKLRIYQRFT